MARWWQGPLAAWCVAAVLCAGAVHAQDGGTKPVERGDAAKAKVIDVVVTVPPLRGLVEPLLPEGSRVTVLMKPGRSEHGYELTPADVERVAKADLFVYVGVGLEARVERVLEKRSGGRGVVCFADVVGGEKVREVQGRECTEEHAHDAHDDHTHDEHDRPDEHHHHDEHGGDQHLWLDPVLVKDLVPALAVNVEEALKSRGAWNDADSAALAARKEATLARVDRMDREYRERLGRAVADGTDAIITHHDAFSRLAKRYGLRVAAVIRVGSSGESSPGDLAKVMAAAKESGAKAIFREPQYDARGAERLAERAGLNLLTLDPLGDGDWFAMMRKNLDALEAGLRDDKDTPRKEGK